MRQSADRDLVRREAEVQAERVRAAFEQIRQLAGDDPIGPVASEADLGMRTLA
jgi:hypothetical protein